MTDMMRHAGYFGSVRYSASDHVLFGKLEYIRDLVTYEATDVAGLEAAFIDAVEDYLDTCRRAGRTPETPFKGTFNVRTGPERHRLASVYAATHAKSLNQVVNEALDAYLDIRPLDDEASAA